MITQVKIEKIDGQDCLVVVLPLQQPERSSTGRSLVVAQSAPRFQETEVEIQGKKVAVMVNAVISAR